MKARLAMVAFVMHSSIVFAQTRGTCDSAYEGGQEARAAGHLRDAAEKFVACSHPMCPTFEQSDCTKWLAELKPEIPSVTVTMQDPNGSLAGAKAMIDGRDVGAAAVDIDPGSHVLVCERQSERTETKFEIARGQSKSMPCVFAATVTHAPIVRSGNTNLAAWFLGGTGLAILGVGVVLDMKGYFVDTLALKTCSPHCAQSDVNTAWTELAVGEVMEGIGVALLGIATYLFIQHTHAPKVAWFGKGIRIAF